MKILAPFDGSTFSEATLPILQRLALLPSAELMLMSVGREPAGTAMRGARRPVIGGEILGTQPVVIERQQATAAETKEQAVARRLGDIEVYLAEIARRIASAANVSIEAHVGGGAAEVIVACAREYGADVIVMATHSRKPVSQILFGSTTEAVVRSGIAPVLLVHPKDA